MTAMVAATVRPSYPSEQAALRRVENLKAHGIWPGMIRLADDRWVLTYDPEGVYR